ncbi:hypothetical protein TKK_0008421 [Trichogramma kaykai]|uniref:Uncharacterized protein n=1 Tax=Trichogramma kaykai TaxID=54128 RepID=A0ABD2X5L0_9HYME
MFRKSCFIAFALCALVAATFAEGQQLPSDAPRRVARDLANPLAIPVDFAQIGGQAAKGMMNVGGEAFGAMGNIPNHALGGGPGGPGGPMGR